MLDTLVLLVSLFGICWSQDWWIGDTYNVKWDASKLVNITSVNILLKYPGSNSTVRSNTWMVATGVNNSGTAMVGDDLTRTVDQLLVPSDVTAQFVIVNGNKTVNATNNGTGIINVFQSVTGLSIAGQTIDGFRKFETSVQIKESLWRSVNKTRDYFFVGYFTKANTTTNKWTISDELEVSTLIPLPPTSAPTSSTTSTTTTSTTPQPTNATTSTTTSTTTTSTTPQPTNSTTSTTTTSTSTTTSTTPQPTNSTTSTTSTSTTTSTTTTPQPTNSTTSTTTTTTTATPMRRLMNAMPVVKVMDNYKIEDSDVGAVECDGTYCTIDVNISIAANLAAGGPYVLNVGLMPSSRANDSYQYYTVNNAVSVDLTLTQFLVYNATTVNVTVHAPTVTPFTFPPTSVPTMNPTATTSTTSTTTTTTSTSTTPQPTNATTSTSTTTTSTTPQPTNSTTSTTTTSTTTTSTTTTSTTPQPTNSTTSTSTTSTTSTTTPQPTNSTTSTTSTTTTPQPTNSTTTTTTTSAAPVRRMQGGNASNVSTTSMPTVAPTEAGAIVLNLYKYSDIKMDISLGQQLADAEIFVALSDDVGNYWMLDCDAMKSADFTAFGWKVLSLDPDMPDETRYDLPDNDYSLELYWAALPTFSDVVASDESRRLYQIEHDMPLLRVGLNKSGDSNGTGHIMPAVKVSNNNDLSYSTGSSSIEFTTSYNKGTLLYGYISQCVTTSNTTHNITVYSTTCHNYTRSLQNFTYGVENSVTFDFDDNLTLTDTSDEKVETYLNVYTYGCDTTEWRFWTIIDLTIKTASASSSSALSPGAIVGIVCAGVLVCGLAAWWLCMKKGSGDGYSQLEE